MCPINLTHGVGQEKALRYAATLAGMFGAKLYVYYSIENVEPFGTQMIEAAEEELQKFVERLMSAVFTRAEDAVPDWESFVIRGNDPSEAITREAAKLRIDLIVMCSRRRPLRAALIGSTAERVSRSAPCPVLVTHPDQREGMNGKPGPLSLKRVLVAHDFSDYAEMALNYARLFAQKNNVELHLLHVLSAPSSSEPEIAWTQGVAEGAYHKAARQLQRFVPSEAKRWHEVTTAVRLGKPYREVLDYAKEQQIDLICMGAHGAGFELQALFGSNVDRVLRQAPCPVLIARPLKPSLAAQG